MDASVSDRRELAELERELAVIDLDGPSVFRVASSRLLKLLRTESALAYTIRCEDGGASLAEASISGLGAGREVDRELDAWIRRSSGAWAHYDPRRPEPAQRNRVLTVGSWRALAAGVVPAGLARARISREESERRARSIASARSMFVRWGTVDAQQMRVILCEGPHWLGFVAALQHGKFDRRAVQLLRAAVPALRRRLAIEARVRSMTASPLVTALLDQIPGAAFVLDGGNHVVAANEAGSRAMASDTRRCLEQLRHARRQQGDARFATVDLSMRGVPRHALVLERAVAPAPARSVGVAAARFGLTPREQEVLAQLARGHTNHAIAASLDCSERTIESHVSRILAKLDCASRSAAIAMLGTLG